MGQDFIILEVVFDVIDVLLGGLVTTLDTLVFYDETEDCFQFKLNPLFDSSDEAFQETGEFLVGERFSPDGPDLSLLLVLHLGQER